VKLLYCPHCGDIVRLFPEKRTCRCGKSWGHYLEDGATTVQTWPSLSLGLANPDFRSAEATFGSDPRAFTAALTIRCWINPVSEPDVTFVRGTPLADDAATPSSEASDDAAPTATAIVTPASASASAFASASAKGEVEVQG
jgi:hypothetical protein